MLSLNKEKKEHKAVKKQRGFTLVEIMIVVAIIGLLAAIAIPNLLRARLNANESAIKGEMRTFSSGNETFRSTQNPPTYAPNINALIAPATGPAFVDTTWGNAVKHGYTFAYASNVTTYTLLSTPSMQGQTANNTYCVDQSGVISGSTSDGNANIPSATAAGCTGGISIL